MGVLARPLNLLNALEKTRYLVLNYREENVGTAKQPQAVFALLSVSAVFMGKVK